MTMAVYPTFPGGKRKAFTLSYDDGWPQDRRLISMMNQYGVKGTFNLNSADKLFHEMEDPKELYRGHEIAVHGLTHGYLDRLAPQTVTYEIMKDRENLEHVFGGSVRGFAYAHGVYNDTTVNILKSCGIKYARTITSTGDFSVPSDWYCFNPTCSDNSPELLELCDRFFNDEPSFAQSKLFYVWGHSCFIDDWDRMERLFKAIGSREDVWCATNIEIYDYLSAFQNLVTSADSRYLYNPTMTTLSLISNSGDFMKKQEVFEIKPGEELYLA